MLLSAIVYREYWPQDIPYIREILKSHCKETNRGIILINSGLPKKKAHRFYESKGYCKKSFGFIKIL